MSKKLPSNISFGFLFAGIFALLSAYTGYKGGDALRIYGWLLAGIVVGLVAVAFPNLLTPFNKAWMKLGDLMSKVVSPLVLGVIFFVLITPIALIGRLFGRDELRLKKANMNSYWIERVPPGPAGESFKNQF
jgi:Na+/H+-dicarboxylate symporter